MLKLNMYDRPAESIKVILCSPLLVVRGTCSANVNSDFAPTTCPLVYVSQKGEVTLEPELGRPLITRPLSKLTVVMFTGEVPVLLITKVTMYVG